MGSIRGTLSPRSFRDGRARFDQGGTAPRARIHAKRVKRRPYIHGLVLAIIFIAVGYATVFGTRLAGGAHAFAAPVTGLSLPGVGSSIPAVQDAVVRADPSNRTLQAIQPVPTAAQEVAAKLASLSASPTPKPPAPTRPDEGAAVRAASVAPPPDVPPYQVYQVQPGDTITAIAARFGIDAQYIIANNAEIQDSNFLKLGQSVIIPAGNGILHEVRYGETLSDIAAHYSVDIAAITSFAPNHITTADNIKETQLLFVPGATIPAPPAAPAATPAPDAQPAAPPAGGAGGNAPAAPPAGPPGAHRGKGLIWPVVGPISSCYCPWHPLGIDIDGYNLAGAPIVAATSGTVIFAGGNACCSYGLHVIVMSPGGIETLYGHLSSIAVTQGQTVAQGQKLGIIGSTGYSTGRHLHFEVIDNGVRENPLDYLPGTPACEPGQCQ
ncbi:MAG: peptidoglycan DD-metalloendopeptidase family protein [Dehalococcoidia bacterium]